MNPQGMDHQCGHGATKVHSLFGIASGTTQQKLHLFSSIMVMFDKLHFHVFAGCRITSTSCCNDG